MSKSQELVVYGGRRLHGEKLVQVFLRFDADEKTLNRRSYTFSQVKYPVIGASYHVDIDGESVTIKREPPRVSDSAVSEEQRDAWWSEERADKERHRDNLAEKRLAEHTPVAVQAAISSLTNFTRTMERHDVRGLVNYIVEEAWRRPRPDYKSKPFKTRKTTKKKRSKK